MTPELEEAHVTWAQRMFRSSPVLRKQWNPMATNAAAPNCPSDTRKPERPNAQRGGSGWVRLGNSALSQAPKGAKPLGISGAG